jgi:hypothetical protein
MTSTRQFLPYEYYSLPFCQPKHIRYRPENLGEVLRGDRITNTPYAINMNNNITCRLLCPDSHSKSDAVEYGPKDVKAFIDRIKEECVLGHVPCSLAPPPLNVAAAVTISVVAAVLAAVLDAGFCCRCQVLLLAPLLPLR